MAAPGGRTDGDVVECQGPGSDRALLILMEHA
jgi:hypothetical protein